MKFITGIGIPADLKYESLTIGYVLKAEFYLPYNASIYRQNPFFPDYKTIHKTENQRKFNNAMDIRWKVYDFIEQLLER